MSRIFGFILIVLATLLSSCSTMSSSDDITFYFETNGGSQLETLHYLGDLNEMILPVTMRDGFEFVGWYTDKNLTYPLDLTILNGVDSITIYAKWNELIIDPNKITT